MNAAGDKCLVSVMGKYMKLFEIPSFIAMRAYLWAGNKVPLAMQNQYPDGVLLFAAACPTLARPPS